MVTTKSFLKNSLFSILGRDSSRLDAGRAKQLEHIREAMLSSLDFADDADLFPLERRIRNAKDVQGLWYLRADLMLILAGRLGETAARAKLEHITALFQGLLPRSLMARPSPLSA